MAAPLSDIDSDTVSAMMRDPKWTRYTDPSEWHPYVLSELIARDVQTVFGYLGAHHSSGRTQQPLPIDPALHSQLGMGVFACLPTELIVRIMDELDFRSFGRFVQTCRFVHAVVTLSPSRGFIFQHIPKIPTILVGLGLTQWVSLRELRLEVQHSACRSCGATGDHLFLPTCERLCYNCLRYNPAYWPISLRDAGRAFNINPPCLKHLRTFRNTDRVLGQGHFFQGSANPAFLIPVKTVFNHALRLWGSPKGVLTMGEMRVPDRFDDATSLEISDAAFHRYLRYIMTYPQRGDSTRYRSIRRNVSLWSDYVVAGTASVPCVYVPAGSDHPVPRYHCQGCHYLLDRFPLNQDHLVYMGIDRHLRPEDYLPIMADRVMIAHTWEELRDHIAQCLGCGLMMWQKWSTRRGYWGHDSNNDTDN